MSDHRRARGPVSALAALALVAALPALGAEAARAADQPAPPAAAAAPAGQLRAFTLVTGDEVTAHVTADGRLADVRLRDASGREALFTTFTDAGGTYVFPAGIEPQIDAGKVDLDLFNITKLLADGYDDTSSDTLPVIVTYATVEQADELARKAPAGTQVTSRLSLIKGAAVRIRKGQAAGVWRSLAPAGTPLAAPDDTAEKPSGQRLPAARIWLDDVVRATDKSGDSDSPTVPLTGADVAHRLGYDGTGVKVAVLDTGYDTGHPDLVGRVVAERSFIGWEGVEDRNGHGTHTASTVAGTGAASQGAYAGMAPGADLLIGKVLDNTGAGYTSGIIQGMQWAVDNGAKVVSMSLGAVGVECAGPDVDAIRALSDQALFVIAAGNSGLPGSVSTPGCAPDALTVGAVDRHNASAYFTSRGPVFGGTAAKPDIASQGVDVVAARAGGRGDLAYVSYSGTSMATPHVAGGAALVLDARPDLTPAEVKEVLTSAAGDTGADVLEQGAGPMDVGRAVTQQVVAPPNLQLGDFSYPQKSLPVTQAPVTFTNLGGTAVTLKLQVEELLGGDGVTPVPAAMVRPLDSHLTVSGGQNASVQLRIDPGLPVKDAAYGTVTGRLVGTAKGVQVEVPFSLHLEEPSADVTVVGIDRFGNPAASPSTWDLIDPTHGRARHVGFDADGTATARLRLGTYTIAADIMTRDEPTNASGVTSVAFFARHNIKIDSDTTITLDARDAQPLSWRTDQLSQPFGYTVGYTYDLTGSGIRLSSFATAPSYVDAVYTESQGKRDERFTFGVTTRAYAPRATVATQAGPLDYWSVAQTPPLHGQGAAPLVAVDRAALLDQDLTGKVVLVAAQPSWPVSTIARDAARVGAVAMIAYYPSLLGKVTPAGGSGAPIPVISVRSDEGARLAAAVDAGPVTLRWSGEQPETSPYVYNLAWLTTGTVATGSQRVRDSELSAQRAGYYTQGDSRTLWTDVQFKIPGMSSSVWAAGSSVGVLAPTERTDYFTAHPDVAWTSIVAPGVANTGGAFDGPRSRTAGQETTSWYKAPTGMSLSTNGTPLFRRDANRLRVSTPWFGDAGGHDALGAYPDSRSVTVNVDGRPARYDGAVIILPDDEATVTARASWQRPVGSGAIRWSIGIAEETAWTFRTSAAQQGAQAVPVPVLDLPLQLTNTVPGGTAVPLQLSAVTNTSSGKPVPITDVKAWYAAGSQSSVAGIPASAWTELPVTGTGTQKTATVPAVPTSSGYVHLKVELTTADGATVTQTMVRGYGLT
ncbi:PA domain-containing protein [Micromonospora viridifaciens]|uniref:PA domain-containing protein n=1 Tax=Micromonospora viridifaciens TaxID=1881 RepID=A0A1C4YBI1_MICVI|nr:S8 family serine peptidase [Micromonospora viridifaciens]SCF18085.1 PA domain-containing protein [Micromonospora viridifaciens]